MSSGRTRPDLGPASVEGNPASMDKFDRYGMDNEDWRHLDDYWGTMYGDVYPREKEWNRGGTMETRAGRASRNYEKSDEQIGKDVIQHLTRQPTLEAGDIEVSVQEGVVTLGGTVGQREMKRMVEDEAEAVPGVKDVRNEIRVEKHEWREDQRAA